MPCVDCGQEEKAAKELAKGREQESGADEKKDDEKLRPNPQLEQGNTLPAKMGEFPPDMFGLPIEDVDEYYFNKYVRMSSVRCSLSRAASRALLFC